jgi:uncharacterized protein DUF3558
MVIRRSFLVASLMGIVFVSACTTTSQGEPQPADSTETSSPRTSGGDDEELPFAGAPKVDDPLDTSRYERDPCRSLTADQAEGLNLPRTGKTMDDVALGVGCSWRNPDTWGEAEIIFIVDDPRGLSPEYESKKQGKFPNFEELPDIKGYPAITRRGPGENGDCTVVVGVADDMAFESNIQLSRANIGKKEPCQVASQVAGLAIETMRERA